MSKFKLPPQAEPSAALDQWVSGEQRTAAAEKPAKLERSIRMARLTIDLPEDLHASFKATCALRKTRMIDEVRQFIEGWVQKHGKS
jgi:hypothetical protein